MPGRDAGEWGKRGGLGFLRSLRPNQTAREEAWRMRLLSLLRSIGLLPMLSLTAACGNGSSSVDPNAPVITNLRANLDVPCMLGDIPSSVPTFTLDYVDADGNVRGGMLGVTNVTNIGRRLDGAAPIPSPEVTISGTTLGTITATPARFCYGAGSSATVTVQVIDATAKSSNILTIEVRN